MAEGGAKTVPQMSKYLQNTFLDLKGFPARNLGYAKRLAEAWGREEVLQEPFAKSSWFNPSVNRLRDFVAGRSDRLYRPKTPARLHPNSRDVHDNHYTVTTMVLDIFIPFISENRLI